MKKVIPVLVILITSGLMSCSVFSKNSGSTTKVVRPKYHKTGPKDHQWLVDIPVGARHIRFFERKRTQVVRMH
jgi:hypothetical protein